MLEEPDENIYLNIRHTKDFRFITLNVFSDTHSKVLPFIHLICIIHSWSPVCYSWKIILLQVYLIRASDPLSRMTLVWEGESQVHCIVEHHHGHLYLFTDAAREGVCVNSHYLMQCDVESPGPKSWKVCAMHLLCHVKVVRVHLFSRYACIIFTNYEMNPSEIAVALSNIF